MNFCAGMSRTLAQEVGLTSRSISFKLRESTRISSTPSVSSPPILEQILLLFAQIAQMGLILPRWGLILPRIPPPTPVLYSAVTRSAVTSDPTPKHPFSWPELESGQNELPTGQPGPNRAKCLKSGQNFSRSGQKHLFIFPNSSEASVCNPVPPVSESRYTQTLQKCPVGF